MRAIRRAAGVHPRIAQDLDAREASLTALVDAALEPLDATQQGRAADGPAGVIAGAPAKPAALPAAG